MIASLNKGKAAFGIAVPKAATKKMQVKKIL